MSSRVQATFAGLILVLAATVAGLYLHPPELLRVGANYGAKIVCSNVFIAGRDAQGVLENDVHSANPALKLVRVSVDREQGTVRAGMLGFIGNGLAVYRPGTGCATIPDGDISRAAEHRFDPVAIAAPAADTAWPAGSRAATDSAVAAVLADETLTGPGWRAVVVIHQGKLVGQRYAPGFDERTPLLGWSMTKTVTAALIGQQVGAGRMALEQHSFWPESKDDPRNAVRLADLLAMSSGLRFNEGYGSVSDVTRMLFLEPDMAAFVASLPQEHPVGTAWNYASGTTVFLSRLWQSAAGGGNAALALPQNALFAPLGMSSAVIEADARGTLVGSSYMYATAQDWARFGQFLLQDGVWNEQRLLPEGYVRMMTTVAPASKGEYGQGQLWRNIDHDDSPTNSAFTLPADTFWLSGHDAQSVAVVPSEQLVVVRLGLTPSALNYKPQRLLQHLIEVIRQSAKAKA